MGEREQIDTVYDLAIELAHALRLAVTTEFKRERRDALDKWERHVLNLMSKRKR